MADYASDYMITTPGSHHPIIFPATGRRINSGNMIQPHI